MDTSDTPLVCTTTSIINTESTVLYEKLSSGEKGLRRKSFEG